jgi:hypothetical protein
VSGNELVIVMVLNLIALGLGVWLNDLGVVLVFVGAIGASTACFIMPGLIYIGVNGGEFLKLTTGIFSSLDDVDECSKISCTHSYSLWYYVFGFPLWCRLASMGEKNMYITNEIAPVVGQSLSKEEVDPTILLDIEERCGDPVTEYFFHQDETTFSCSYFLYDYSSSQVVKPTPGRFMTAIFFVLLGITVRFYFL